MDSSRSRIALRTCTMPEIFKHTTSNTIPVSVSPSASMTLNRELARLPTGVYGAAMPALFSFVDGYCFAKDDVIAETAALACATLTPGDRRPWIATHSLLRSVPPVRKRG